jgi:hypothetical protein
MMQILISDYRTVIGKGLVTHRIIVFFRGIILLDLIPNLATCILQAICFVFQFPDILEKNTFCAKLIIALLIIMTFTESIIFGGFCK